MGPQKRIRLKEKEGESYLLVVRGIGKYNEEANWRDIGLARLGGLEYSG